MKLALDFIRSFSAGKATYCRLSYEPENEAASRNDIFWIVERYGEYLLGILTPSPQAAYRLRRLFHGRTPFPARLPGPHFLNIEHSYYDGMLLFA